MPAGSVAIGHNFTALLMRAGAAGPLQTQLAMERYAIYDYHQAVSAVERCYNRVANEGDETGQAQLNKFGLRDDKEIRAALNMSRHVTACLKRMKYTGMLKDWLMNKTTGGGSVSEQEFNQRMRNKKCAACGAPDCGNIQHTPSARPPDADISYWIRAAEDTRNSRRDINDDSINELSLIHI